MPASNKKGIMLAIYAALQEVESKIQEYPKLIFIFRFYEFLMMIYLIIRTDIVDPKLNSTNILNPGFIKIDHYLYYKQVQQLLLLAYSIISFLFFVLIFLSQTQNKKFQRNIIVWICTIIILLTRFFYLYTIHQVLNVFSQKSSYFPFLGIFRYALLVPIFFFILYSAIVNRNNYIYGIFYPLLVTLPILDPSDYALFVFLTGAFIYKNIYQQQSKDNIFISSLMVPVVYKLFQSFKKAIQYTQLIFLLFFISILIVHVFWKSLQITIFFEKKSTSANQSLSSKRKLIEQYYDYIKNKKETTIKIEDQFLIESIIIDEYERCHENSIQKMRKFINGKKVSEWSEKDHITFLLSQCENYCSQQKSKQSHLILFQCQLQDMELHYHSLLSISQQFYKESVFSIHKYNLYRLIMRLQLWFQKYKNQSSYVENAMKIDNLVINFYDNLDILFQLFLSIWGTIKKQVINFSKIQPMYIKSIQKYKIMQNTIGLLRKNVKSHHEIYKFNKVSNLLQLKVLSEQDTKISHIDNQQQDQVPFLRICNRKIVYSSYKFNSRFKFRRDQIVGREIDQIIQENFRSSFMTTDEQQQNGVHLKLKQFFTIMTNGQNCLQYVKISPYIQLNFLQSITYTVFFNLQHNKNFSCMLYSVDTDTIQSLSIGFCQTFDLQRKDSHNIVTGKQAFQQYDFSSFKYKPQTIKEGMVISTSMRISQFKSTVVDRFNNIKVNLIVVKLFDFEANLRILFEVKPLEMDGITKLRAETGIIPSSSHLINIKSEINLQKEQSKQFRICDQNQQNLRFMADLVQKKQAFNRDKSKDNFMKNHWNSITRCVIFLISVIIIAIFLVYGFAWYSFMQKQMERINSKLQHFIALFQNQFMISILRNWPSSFLSQHQIEVMIQKQFTQLSTEIQDLYLTFINTMEINSLPFINFDTQINLGSQFQGTTLDAFDIFYSSYLLYSEDITGGLMNLFLSVPAMMNSIAENQKNLQIFVSWMNISIITCAITLILMISFRIYQNYHEKFYEKIREDIEMLFSFLKDQQIDTCVKQIEKTHYEFSNNQQIKRLNRNKEKMNLIETQLKTLKMIQSQVFIQKKTVKSDGNNLKSLVKSLVYVGVMICFYVYLITYLFQLKKEVPSIIKYQNQLHLACRGVQLNLVVSYYQMIKQKTGNSSTQINMNNMFVDSLIKQDDLIPPQFKQFYGKIWQILNNDLCVQMQPAEEQKCKSSIMAKGLINSININYLDMEHLVQRGLDDLFQDELHKQIMYIRKQLLKYMDSIVSLYESEMSAYLSYRTNICLIIVAIAFAITLFSIALLRIDYKDQFNNNSICKSLFNIFPQSFFLKPEIMEYVEQTKLTQRLLQF